MTVLLTFLAAFAAAPAAGTAITATSVCELVARPEAFNGKLVRFRAGVLTDWQHGAVLVHSGCSRGVELTSIDGVPSHETEALDKAVGTPLDGGRERTAMATFTGRFWFQRGKPQRYFGNKLRFNATRVESVVVHPNERER